MLARILDAFESGNVPEALARTMLPRIDYIRRYAEHAGQDVHRACLSVLSDVGWCLDAILSQEEEGRQVSLTAVA